MFIQIIVLDFIHLFCLTTEPVCIIDSNRSSLFLSVTETQLYFFSLPDNPEDLCKLGISYLP